MINLSKIKEKIIMSSSSDKFFLFVCTTIIPTLIIIIILTIRDSIVSCSIQKQNIVNYQYQTIINVLENKPIPDNNPFLEIVKFSEKEDLIELKNEYEKNYKDKKITKREYLFFSNEFQKLYK